MENRNQPNKRKEVNWSWFGKRLRDEVLIRFELFSLAGDFVASLLVIHVGFNEWDLLVKRNFLQTQNEFFRNSSKQDL